ncbi:MAG TPA: serine/threonine-protein kinase [Polyangiaceae bacterium]|nr:serine/threonine-protein kinase [Polyangiaceae bacterium]
MVAARLLPVDPGERQRIDRYELVAEIASGGMATVFLARRAGVGGFQRFVAVKRLHPHLAAEVEFVQMFLDEARIAALIHHPNVVSISEVGASDRGYYLVMDYIEGDTLARLISECAETKRVVPIGVGLRIVIDMLTGLHAAHELRDEQGNPSGLVHRDVSPQNILVGLDGIARISDFGVARAAMRLAGTRVGQLKGKLAYMAPEQAAADDQLDRRADVFAAGIVLWELLAGRRLFRAPNDAATLSRVVSGPIVPPNRFVEGIDSRIVDVCMKALERPLSRRIATAGQFAEMLETAAVRAGFLGTSRDVSAYLQVVLGEEVARHRQAIRKWVSECDEVEVPSSAFSRAPSSGPMARVWSEELDSPLRSSPRARTVSSRTDNGPEDLTVVASPRQPWWVYGGGALALLLVGAACWALGAWSTARHPPNGMVWSRQAETAPGFVRAATAEPTEVPGRAPTSVAGFATDEVQTPKGQATVGTKVGRSSFADRKSRGSARPRKDDVDLTNPYTR